MSTTENNRLIAEFMRHKIVDNGITKHFYYIQPMFVNGRLSNNPGSETVTTINNLYNTSWDWLMPVVEKIETTPVKTVDEKEQEVFLCPVFHCHRGETIESQMTWYTSWRFFKFFSYITVPKVNENKLTAVYESVVAFIQWYNTQTPAK